MLQFVHAIQRPPEGPRGIPQVEQEVAGDSPRLRPEEEPVLRQDVWTAEDGSGSSGAHRRPESREGWATPEAGSLPQVRSVLLSGSGAPRLRGAVGCAVAVPPVSSVGGCSPAEGWTDNGATAVRIQRPEGDASAHTGTAGCVGTDGSEAQAGSAMIKEVDPPRVATFVEQWHYSNRMPTGKNVAFEWIVDGELYAVAVYGIGVNPYQAQFLGVTDRELIELKRLCRVEPRNDAYPLTMFLAECHRRLRTVGYRMVVSFSDPDHSHHGGIYRAANFQHAGKSNPEWHLVGADGEVRHRRFAFRYARRNKITVGDARSELGVKRVQTAPKDRWVLRLRGRSSAPRQNEVGTQSTWL